MIITTYSMTRLAKGVKRTLGVQLVVVSVAGVAAPAVALDSDAVDADTVEAGASSTMDHSKGAPPEDSGDNGSEVPGVGRPGCIPPDRGNGPDNGGGNGDSGAVAASRAS